MKRSLMNDLLEWKESVNPKPIVLRGARQVGQTTLVRMLGAKFDVFLN